MKLTKLHAIYNKMKGILKQKKARLTNNNALLIEGKKDEFLARLQLKFGKTKKKIQKIISHN